MPTVVVAVSLLANIGFFGLFVWLHTRGWVSMADLKPFDVATIALLAATLVVAVVGVIIAMVTFVGFRDIKKASVKAAEIEARKVATSVAETVATRTAFATPQSETGPDDANQIAEAAANG